MYRLPKAIDKMNELFEEIDKLEWELVNNCYTREKAYAIDFTLKRMFKRLEALKK